jgi:hypothetical protein
MGFKEPSSLSTSAWFSQNRKTRFVEINIPVRAITASGAQNGSGVFELSFRDGRHLPFEGAGAISEWSLELFTDLPTNNLIRPILISVHRYGNSTTARLRTRLSTSSTRRERTLAPSRMVRSRTFATTSVKTVQSAPGWLSTCGAISGRRGPGLSIG